MNKQQFFLKTAPLPGEPASAYTNLYIRHHGSGINSVVLTPGTPKFIKGHLEGSRINFTSSTHQERQWGLTLCIDGATRAGWEKVEIVENGGSDRLQFSSNSETNEEVLEFEGEDAGEKVWRGWMVCEWASGHPQLFWLTDKLKDKLPPFCHRVQIVRELL
ncbi:hypothetical protein HK100_009304 [Physocladia obscura]|uniref:DUF7907 domain-containing protein n=1 Tax=Physocladia obscura TaxID=109957 RepID=A0AAD5T553_9FUNG|nr:hypothetical protein HK100_009304 [Physocladia obscura]